MTSLSVNKLGHQKLGVVGGGGCQIAFLFCQESNSSYVSKKFDFRKSAQKQPPEVFWKKNCS